MLKAIDLNKEPTEKLGQLSKLTNSQISLSTQALQFIKNGKTNESRKLIDSLRSLKLTDSVYSAALVIEKYLEKDLQAIFSNNTKVSARLSEYNSACHYCYYCYFNIGHNYYQQAHKANAVNRRS